MTQSKLSKELAEDWPTGQLIDARTGEHYTTNVATRTLPLRVTMDSVGMADFSRRGRARFGAILAVEIPQWPRK